MSRRSTFAVSTLVSELKVLSTTLPDSTCLSLVRTTVLPLPGLWCWNHRTDQSWPSRSSTMPFFRSFVEATQQVLGDHPGLADLARGRRVEHKLAHRPPVLRGGRDERGPAAVGEHR